jgi:pyrophosphatase PpaX
LFDLDGTLIDSQELILSSFRYATKEVLGHALPDERLLPLIGMPLINQVKQIAPDKAEELVEVYRVHNAEQHDALVAYFDGTREMLQELLDAGLRLAVVTSKRNQPALRSLELFKLTGYFEVFIGSEDTDKHKPLPDPLLLAAERMRLQHDECVYVGDSPYDMQAARAAEMVAVAALWGMFTAEVLLSAGAQYQADKPSALPALLRELVG